jgi:hypothetical protein
LAGVTLTDVTEVNVVVTVESARNPISAVAVLVGSAWLVAVTVTVVAVGIDEGAVYNPTREIVPITGLMDHDIPLSFVPDT